MRKISVYAFTMAASIIAAGSAPMISFGAMNTFSGTYSGSFSLPGGNGKVMVIGGSGKNDLGQILNQIGMGGNGADCDFNWSAGIPDNSLPKPGIPAPDMPDQNIPQQPDNQLPDNQLPDNQLPDNQLPENQLPDNQLPDNQQPDVGDQNSGNYDVIKRVADLVNEERAKAGLSPLTLDASVSAAAQTRSVEIVRSFSHTRPDGSSFSTALTAEGLNYRAAGENIAYGQRSPEEVMEGWMNSSGHRANILSKEYTSIGVGHYQNGGVDYWTQIFMR